MHVTAVLDAMKKHGHFNDYDRALKAYEETTKAAESVEAGLALLKETSAGTTSKRKKKVLRRPRKPQRKPLQRPTKPSQKPRRL